MDIVLAKEEADTLNAARRYCHHDDCEGDFHENQIVTAYELIEIIEMLMAWKNP